MIYASLVNLLLTGCANSGPVIDFCAVVDPIYVSKSDVLTEDTAQQILDHNVFWDKECRQ